MTQTQSAAAVTDVVRQDWRYRHEYVIEHRRHVTDQLTGDLETAMVRTESILSDLGRRGSSGVWLENESLLAIRHVLVALGASRAALVRAEAREATLRDAAASALYRFQEHAPRHVTEDAYGLSEHIGTDAGHAMNELRKAAGITVTRNALGGYEFARAALQEG